MKWSLVFFGAVACSATPDQLDTSASAFRATPAIPIALDGVDPFAGIAELSADRLAGAVLARNPTLERMRQSWRAALGEVDQRGALPDAMLGVQVAPLSLVASEVRAGGIAALSQALPWAGKRRLRAEVALAEADAARRDLAATRQRLALMAVSLHAEYALVDRAIEINAEHIELLGELGHSVEVYLETGKAWQEEALEVDVELVRRRRESSLLHARRDVVRAQINALLHRAPAAPLPSPTPLADPRPPPGEVDALTRAALERRPELGAIDSRARGADSAIALAEKERLPDLEVKGSYNSMWPEVEHRFMVGISITLPTARSRRAAAIDEARARRAAIDAGRAEHVDEIARDVAVSHARLRDAIAAVALYRDELVPAARDRVAAIRIGLDAGRTTFRDVIRAETGLRAAELDLEQARAQAQIHRAELDWATGAAVGGER